MNIRLYWLKFKLALSVFFSKIIYNFHKPINGIAVNRGIRYAKGKGNFHKLDVYYPTESKNLLKIFKRRNKNLIDTYESAKEDPIRKIKPCIFYIHGGGWSTLDKSMYETLCKRLASFGYVVFNCNYELAPKNNIEGIVDDCSKAVAFASLIASNYGGDSDRLILAGDSAGAHIVSLISGMNKFGIIDEYNYKNRIKALLLFYGVFDLNNLISSGHKDIKLYLHSILKGRYSQKQEIYNKFSPINYVSSNFPPSLIVSGEVDKLHNTQSKFFSDLLTKNNVINHTYFVPANNFKGFHGFMSIDGLQTNVDGLIKVKEFLDEIKV